MVVGAKKWQPSLVMASLDDGTEVPKTRSSDQDCLITDKVLWTANPVDLHSMRNCAYFEAHF